MMKRLLLALALLSPVSAWAQVTPSPVSQAPLFGMPAQQGASTNPFANVVFTGQALGPDSCVAYSFTSAATTGYGYNGSALCMNVAGTTRATITGISTLSSGTGIGFALDTATNQTLTAGFTDFRINRTQTAVGSGAQFLIDAQVGGSSQFNLSNIGNVVGNGWFAGRGFLISATGATTGAASSDHKIAKAVTAIANAVATDVFTVTVPNASHMATIRVTLSGSLGAGGAIGAGEATGNISYDFAVTRTAGVAAAVGASAAYGSSTAAVAGAATITIAGAASAISGAVGVTQTFTIQVTITRGSGASTNHTVRATAEIINANASGITVS